MLFRKYETILIDADDTLLDYPSTESGALREMLKEYGIFCKESMAEQFKNICNEEWSRCRLDNVTERSVLEQYHKRYYEYTVRRFARVKQWLSLEETAVIPLYKKLPVPDRVPDSCRSADNAPAE